jgi:hypothetical protein
MDIETQPFYHEQYASFVDNSYVEFTINLKGSNRGVDYAAKENTYASAADYLHRNTDIGKNWRGTAWEHYSLHGKKEGRTWNYIPDIEQSEEAAQDYLTRYTDVAKNWKGKPAYTHYLFYGQYETPARTWNSSPSNTTSTTSGGSTSGAGTATSSGSTSGTVTNEGTIVATNVGIGTPNTNEGMPQTTDNITTTDSTTTSDGTKKKTTLSKPKWVIPAVLGGVLAVGAIAYLIMKKKTV